MLPNEPGGFAVNLLTGEVHKRHAWHAVNHRRTTAAGAAALLHGRDPKLCSDCFPSPPKTSTRFVAKTVKVIEAKPKASKPEPDLSAAKLYADVMGNEEPPETRPEKETPLADGAAVEPAEEPDGADEPD